MADTYISYNCSIINIILVHYSYLKRIVKSYQHDIIIRTLQPIHSNILLHHNNKYIYTIKIYDIMIHNMLVNL